jgi:hypothetical protein
MDEVLAILSEKISEKETELSKLQSAYDCIADLSAVVAPAVEEVEVDGGNRSRSRSNGGARRRRTNHNRRDRRL